MLKFLNLKREISQKGNNIKKIQKCIYNKRSLDLEEGMVGWGAHPPNIFPAPPDLCYPPPNKTQNVFINPFFCIF